LPAKRAFRLATIDGARALGLDASVGSLEVGKKADLAVVRLDGAHAGPGGDVHARLVYACGARDVRHVMVDGAVVVLDGVHQRLDADQVTAVAGKEAARLRKRARLA
jgi:cytosine/adenosine deaminase-related metal-dependent hydrolase